MRGLFTLFFVLGSIVSVHAQTFVDLSSWRHGVLRRA